MLTFKLKYSCGSVAEGTSVRVGFTLEEVIDTTAGVQTPRNGKLTIVGRMGRGGGERGAKVDCLKKKKKDRKEGKQRRRKERQQEPSEKEQGEPLTGPSRASFTCQRLCWNR